MYMQRYQNAGNSGVQLFEAGSEFIILEFRDATRYLYNYIRPGRQHVHAMMKLAEKGIGLATYVNKHIRDNYFERLK